MKINQSKSTTKRGLLGILATFFIGLVALTGCSNKTGSSIRSYELCEEFNTYISKLKLSGKFEIMKNKWVGSETAMVDTSHVGSKGTIKIGATSSIGAPLSYDVGGLLEGLVIDIAYDFAKELDYSVEMVDYSDFGSLLLGVSTGKVDMIAAPVTITEERQENICFSDPIYINRPSFITSQKLADKYASIDDIPHLICGIIEGSADHVYLENRKNCEMITFKGASDALAALNRGDINAFLYDEIMSSKIIETNIYPDLTIFSTIEDAKENIAFCFPKFVEQRLSYYDNKRIGVITGGAYLKEIEERLPEAKIFYFSAHSDMIAALKANKIDFYIDEEPVFNEAKKNSDQILYRLPGRFGTSNYSFAFPKNDKGKERCNDFNIFLYKIIENGTMSKLEDKWFNETYYEDLDLDYKSLKDINGTLHIITSAEYPPFTMVKDGNLTGLEIDVLSLYAQEKGYALDITAASIYAVIGAVNNYDIACTALTENEERKENMYFSDPYYEPDVIYVVRISGTTNDLFKVIAASFIATFITEDRWSLVLYGLLVTIIISVSSIILGSLLGFGIFMIVRKNNKIINVIFKVANYIITGMPVVVLLMVFYYLIFGSSSIPGSVVSIIVFSLIFACSFVKNMKVSTDAISYSQTEASLALGYRENKAFFKIILPQATTIFLPNFKGSAVELIKATAVVGYVTVQDLTKVIDIIRSRTFQAFFPLICVALIYFGICFLISFLISRIEFAFDFRKRSVKKIMKGVKIHD